MEIQGSFHCIALATGVKALPYATLSPAGDLLHDSHAEVLARRGARTWILLRLISEAKAVDTMTEIDGICRLFEKNPENQDTWRLHSDVKLHLYCSTFPCMCFWTLGDKGLYRLSPSDHPLLSLVIAQVAMHLRLCL